MGSVIIGANTYQIYGDQAGATSYLAAELDDAAVAWMLADAATAQRQSLVMATRMIDRQRWQGLPVGAPVIDTVLQWPRTGVIDRYGTAVSSASVPDRVVKATYELAAMLFDDPSKQDVAVAGSNVSSVGAGPAQVSFFRPTIGQLGRFDTRIQELLGEFLGSGTTSGSEGYGTTDADGNDITSAFDDTDTFSIIGSI